MKTIEPLQRVIKGGRTGLVVALGSVVSCAVFYSFQLYRKNHRCLSRQPTLSLGLATVSSLAHRLSETIDMVEFGFDKACEDVYDKDVNPDGIMQLGVADNLLCLDLVEQWVVANWKRSIGCDDDVVGIKGIAPYQPFDGLMDLKLAMANFMSKVMGHISFDPSQLVLTSGATPAIEILAFCLGNPGDAFLIPTPYYSGDLERTGVSLVPVHCRSSENFALSMGAMEQAYTKARDRGLIVRAILLSNPSNPVGTLVPRETLKSLLDFAREKNIHIISDEIFAGSIHGDSKFVSMAEMVRGNDLDKNRVHVIYGISKDLSLAGVRVGSIYTFNESVLKAAKRMTRFCTISSPTQKLLIRMLSDECFILEYMDNYRRRLKRMHDLFVASLDELGIRCSKSDAGLFCWADLSGLIKPDNKKGEMELWDELFNLGKVFLTPGSDLHCIEPGWFRCCFSTLSENDVPLVMKRIRKVCGIPGDADIDGSISEVQVDVNEVAREEDAGAWIGAKGKTHKGLSVIRVLEFPLLDFPKVC